MRGILIENPGPQGRLVVSQVEMPQLHKDELLVRVKAAGLNRADILQRQGKYPPPPGESVIPGLEIAGEIVDIGADVHHFKIGDPVYGLVAV